MVQVLATTFFSAALFAGCGVIATMLSHDMATVRHALGLDPAPRPLSGRVRVRRPDRVAAAMPRRSVSPLRAAA